MPSIPELKSTPQSKSETAWLTSGLRPVANIPYVRPAAIIHTSLRPNPNQNDNATTRSPPGSIAGKRVHTHPYGVPIIPPAKKIDSKPFAATDREAYEYLV
jgi:hypothetical protein